MRLSWRESWRIYRSAPALRMLALGFSAGLPLLLVLVLPLLVQVKVAEMK